MSILDAYKEGFLRSQTSLIQTAGRAARTITSTVMMYADRMTGSIKAAITECNRRRKKQIEFNEKNKITPKGIKKAITEGIEKGYEAQELVREATDLTYKEFEKEMLISELGHKMEVAARNLQFEKAAEIRDKIRELKRSK